MKAFLLLLLLTFAVAWYGSDLPHTARWVVVCWITVGLFVAALLSLLNAAIAPKRDDR
ncbi:hypothetical protein LQK89_02535 [Curtobacterium sp. C1]|uniref:hypothetical protein n=1 Tax=Curtobacterium sp. C1 TaxID=2898151 RepID=UPI001E6599B3|nr:hypothetical protein [Curtobacterium sp. C1]UFU14595.1 hypothetical protein LQK89_02535 [Curtobacterium sp. C1]